MMLLCGVVGEARFELARLATPAPKAGASAVPPLARIVLVGRRAVGAESTNGPMRTGEPWDPIAGRAQPAPGIGRATGALYPCSAIAPARSR